MTVDLRKHHPFEDTIRSAERIAYLGVVVLLAGIGEMIYFRDYQSAFSLTFALAITAYSARQLRSMRIRWPERWPHLRRPR